MNELITVRDADIVAAEIRTIQGQARKMMLIYAVEIGKRLTEAKELVPFGEWGHWLEESVSYSQSTANNMMALYREYGEKEQASLFDDSTNSQLIEKLSYTQALALLAVPAEDRAEFADNVNAEELSTRQLQQAIRERDEARQALSEAEEKAKQSDKLMSELDGMELAAGELKDELEEARKAEATATAKATGLEGKLQEEKEKLRKARVELKEIKENPTVPDDVMARLRQEADTAAAAKAEEAAEKKIAEIKKQLEQAKEDAAIAARSQKAAEDQLQQAQKAATMAAPEVAIFKTLFSGLQSQIEKINAHRVQTAQTNQHAADGMAKAMTALLHKELEELK